MDRAERNMTGSGFAAPASPEVTATWKSPARPSWLTSSSPPVSMLEMRPVSRPRSRRVRRVGAESRYGARS